MKSTETLICDDGSDGIAREGWMIEGWGGLRKPMAALLVGAALLTGCNSLPSNTQSAAEQYLPTAQIDEQALGVIYASATTVNLLIQLAAPHLTVAQAKQVVAIKAKVDAGISAAEQAKKTGDAVTYKAKITELTALINDINAIVKA